MRESRNVRPALRADYSDERDTKRVRPDQERETANGNGEVDLMHGDLPETVTARVVDSLELLFLQGRC